MEDEDNDMPELEAMTDADFARMLSASADSRPPVHESVISSMIATETTGFLSQLLAEHNIPFSFVPATLRANEDAAADAPPMSAYAATGDGFQLGPHDNSAPTAASVQAAYVTPMRMRPFSAFDHTRSRRTAAQMSYRAAQESRLDVVRIMGDIASATSNLEDAEARECEARGSARCGVELTDRGACMSDMAKIESVVRETTREKHRAYAESLKLVESAEKTNRALEDWLMDYTRNVTPFLKEDGETMRHIECMRDSVKTLVDAQLEKNDVKQLRRNAAEALGELQCCVRTARFLPQVATSMQCYLCMDHMCDRAIVPCGHMMCSACHEKTERLRHCYVCRGRVDQVLRLYMN